jgi:hypothetical protein
MLAVADFELGCCPAGLHTLHWPANYVMCDSSEYLVQQGTRGAKA